VVNASQMYFSLVMGFFKRNNLLESFVMQVLQAIYNLVTLSSRLKILKYRFMLETQKLQRVEQTLSAFETMEIQGQKINRRY
jgi:hypothetical protein